LLTLSGTAQAAGNADIITLVRARVGEDAILARIANERCSYNLETPDIVALRRAGASGRVVAAMIRKCATTEPAAANGTDLAQALGLRPGVYAVEAVEGRTKYLLMVPAIVAIGQSGGNGTLLMPSRSRITVPGTSAPPVATAGQLSFWIVSSARALPVSNTSAPPGFEDVSLVRLEQKANRRQLQIASSANGLAMSGVSPERIIKIRLAPKSKTVHVVTVERDLKQGEYALIAKDGASSFRVYDFSIP
jgi:hypothetical protein